jgi:enamine deaminase RidA (YjgF/YER057c/UK114 family)
MRYVFGFLGLAVGGFWLLSATNLSSAAQQPTSTRTVQYVEPNAFQKERSFSPAVITTGGRTIWLAGQTALQDAQGKPLAGDFRGQARAIFAAMDSTLKRSGGSLRNLVSMTVFITDVRNGDQLVKIRSEMFPDGKFPASALITVSALAQPGMLIEIQGVAVVGQ